MTHAKVPCPVCGAPDTQDCGPPAYRLPTLVAGVPIELGDLPLRHRRCPVCTFRFIHPPIPESRLLDCYARAGSTNWGTDQAVADQRFYSHKKELLERFAPSRSVLDFGCFDGGFLEFLGPSWSKAGIEPAKDAAKVAQQRGIEIIGATVDEVDISAHAQKFAAIVIFDVMEHLVDPVKDLARLRELLVPGGIMLIETGNSDAPEWQRFGKYHPYCGVVEHVAFFNRRSIEEAGRRAGMSLAHFETSKHWDYSWYGTRVEAPAYLMLWRLIRGLEKLKLPLSRKLRDIAAGPVPRSADPEDHFLAILRRDS